MFASASSIPTKKAYGSLLRRTQLNVFGNVSRRLSVVLSATLADTEVESGAAVMPMKENKPKPKAGKLATKLIGMMEEENKREERNMQ